MTAIQKIIGATLGRVGAIFFALFLTLGAMPLWAKDIPLKVSPVTLSFQAEETFVPSNFRERLGTDWEAFCERFGPQLIVGKGPQGRGIANRFDCEEIEFVANVKDSTPDAPAWNFIFGWESSGLSLSLYHSAKGQKGDAQLISKIEFPKQFTPDLLFGSEEGSVYVLSRLYRRLPAAWSAVFNKSDLQWQLSPLDSRSLSLMSPARKVGLYALRYSPTRKIWIPILYAIAQPILAEDNRRQIDRAGGEPLELRWVVTPRHDKIRLWAQEIVNPLEKEVEPSFVTMRENRNSGSLLEGYALDGLKSDQVMLRYALPFPKGSTVVSQASKVELVATVGKGLLDGLVFNWEYVPRLSKVEAEDTYSYTWSRMAVGWAFNLGAPQTIERFATQFKLTPKVGLLNMDAYFPLNAAENLEFATVASFKVKSQIDFGGELSWELESLNYRLKVWGTANLSGYILGGENPTKISNQRAGGDAYYDIWKTGGGIRYSVLAFGYIDWVTVQQDTTPQLGLNLATSTTASGASYNVTYIGAGLSITW